MKQAGLSPITGVDFLRKEEWFSLFSQNAFSQDESRDGHCQDLLLGKPFFLFILLIRLL